MVWNISYFHPKNLGKMNPFWRAYFSNGLVQPPTSYRWWLIFDVHPENLGKIFNPFWLLHIFQMAWFNHQLLVVTLPGSMLFCEEVSLRKIKAMTLAASWSIVWNYIHNDFCKFHSHHRWFFLLYRTSHLNLNPIWKQWKESHWTFVRLLFPLFFGGKNRIKLFADDPLM